MDGKTTRAMRAEQRAAGVLLEEANRDDIQSEQSDFPGSGEIPTTPVPGESPVEGDSMESVVLIDDSKYEMEDEPATTPPGLDGGSPNRQPAAVFDGAETVVGVGLGGPGMEDGARVGLTTPPGQPTSMVCGREEGLDVFVGADTDGDQLRRDHAEDHLETVGQGSSAAAHEKHKQETSKALAKEGNGQLGILRSNINTREDRHRVHRTSISITCVCSFQSFSRIRMWA